MTTGSDISFWPTALDSDLLDLVLAQMRDPTQGFDDDLDGTGKFDLAGILMRLAQGLVLLEDNFGVSGAGRYGIIDASAGATVANTTTESSLLAGTLDVPAGFLTTNAALRLTAYGTVLMNNNTADTVALKIKVGSVALVTGVGLPNGASALSATSRKWKLDAMIIASAIGAGGTLHGIADWAMSIPTAGDMAGLTSGSYAAVGGHSATVDTTADNPIDLRATWSAASANDSITCTYAALESVPCL